MGQVQNWHIRYLYLLLLAFSTLSTFVGLLASVLNRNNDLVVKKAQFRTKVYFPQIMNS